MESNPNHFPVCFPQLKHVGQPHKFWQSSPTDPRSSQTGWLRENKSRRAGLWRARFDPGLFYSI
ncbi:hypothetical protein B0H19DRAFT_1142638 [Mycena capillaripes]|nr:hypothetical protein B0H19DRAFT_1142638 [Mycena capillaripes]